MLLTFCHYQKQNPHTPKVMASLGLDPNDVIAENVKKLEARYPGGSFDAFYSENRKDDDL